MVVLIVLCLGVEFFAVSTLCVFSYFHKSGWLSGHLLGKKAAHSVYYMFS